MFNNSNLYDKNEDGKVYCGKNIMLSIINLSAKEISGVASLCTNFASRFKRFFSKPLPNLQTNYNATSRACQHLFKKNLKIFCSIFYFPYYSIISITPHLSLYMERITYGKLAPFRVRYF